MISETKEAAHEGGLSSAIKIAEIQEP